MMRFYGGHILFAIGFVAGAFVATLLFLSFNMKVLP